MSETTTHIDWRGITVAVNYVPNWPTERSNLGFAHLELSSVMPACEPLPVTETGYRSHFIEPEFIEEAGGPVAYALAWLDAVAASSGWQDTHSIGRQLSLF